ncbi:metallophosphoesterase [Stutzerimonas tarimensis]|uniref:Metallophosphoesterase n=1 Tax=Stutzerimonas tarimensis TaxID=1507735 RepID=A0ABV7T1P4_9GAMM
MQLDSERGYDLIGDVHGCAETLVRLLDGMGYRRRGDVWRHPSRMAIFLGDIIDRGPHIRECLHLVHDMVEAGQALCIMGNHEFNALGWYTPAPPESGREFVRDHSPRYAKLLEETFKQFESHPAEWKAFREWFMDMPLYLDGGRFRVVHACWDKYLIARLRERLTDGLIDMDFLREAATDGSFAQIALDRLLRGTDMPLPHGLTVTTDEGFVRTVFRTKFWEEHPKTYADVVFQPDGLPDRAARTRISETERRRLFLYGPDEPMLFVGHYWCSGHPGPIRPNLACLDYSAVKRGKLAAYRLGPEKRLEPANFVWINVEPSDS